MERTGRALLLALTLATVSGCSLTNPYISGKSIRQEINASQVDNSRAPVCSGPRNERLPLDIDAAICDATATRDIMERQAGRYAMLNNAGAPALLGIAGIATYQATRPNNSANVAALTTGGATLFGAQQWIYQRPREAIYLTGAAALSCAIGLATPHSGSSETIEKIKSASELVAKTRLANISLERRAARLSPACHDDLDQALSAAPDLSQLAEREKALQDYRSQTSTVGIDLRVFAEDIRTLVNLHLTAQQPDLSKLPSYIKSLNINASSPAIQHSKGSEGETLRPFEVTSASAEDPDTCSFNATYESDMDALVALIFDTDRAIANAEALASAAPAPDFATQCGIGAFGAPVPLAIATAGVQRILQGDSVKIRITGGTPPYRATLLTDNGTPHAPTLAIESQVGDAANLSVSTTSSTPKKGYAIIVHDRVGASQSVAIEVVAP